MVTKVDATPMPSPPSTLFDTPIVGHAHRRTRAEKLDEHDVVDEGGREQQEKVLAHRGFPACFVAGRTGLCQSQHPRHERGSTLEFPSQAAYECEADHPGGRRCNTPTVRGLRKATGPEHCLPKVLIAMTNQLIFLVGSVAR